MSNRRGLPIVLRDMAAACQAEYDEIKRADDEGMGYSEGAHEELLLRIKACKLGAVAIEIVNAEAEPDEANGETETP